MFYFTKLFIILSLIISLCCCENKLDNQVFSVSSQQNDRSDEEINSLINEFLGNDQIARRKAFTKLIDISNVNEDLRDKVIARLIGRFDILMTNTSIIHHEEKEIIQLYLDLFLKLNATEALDVLVKYIETLEVISSNKTIISSAIVEFGEKAIPSLEKGLNTSDQRIFCRCAATLSELKFKENNVENINKAVEVLERFRKNKLNNQVKCVEQAITTLTERKLYS